MLEFAFYKHSGTLTDKVIKFFSQANYSHVEYVAERTEESMVCLSASKRDNKEVRRKTIKYNKNHWDFIKVEGDPTKAKDFLESQLGEKYNMLGASVSILPFNIALGSGWFCGDLQATVFNVSSDKDFIPYANTLTPGELYNKFVEINKGYNR